MLQAEGINKIVYVPNYYFTRILLELYNNCAIESELQL
jgi:hypothetical protein